ncbi:MAG TPA: glycosyltransferase family 2 protein, partial [Thermomicrobiales bacterium]|nr:glycosyltransferase family 2 protein [Thermomicrobiales bacterium]
LTPFVPHYDVVAGFRQERSDPLNRRINAEIFNVVVRILFGVHLRDLDCAFKIFRGDMLRSLDLTTSGALINAEMQAKLRRSGATIEQVGVGHYPRIAGEATGGNPKVILHAMGETVRLWRRMHRYQPPVSNRREERPYFVLGDVLLGAGLLVGGAIVWKLLRWKRRG